MSRKQKIAGWLSLVAVLAVTAACTKKQNAEVDNETRSVVDFAIIHHDFIALIPVVQQRLANTPGTGSNIKKSGEACEVLTLVSGDTLWAKTGHVNPTYSMQINEAACTGSFADDASRAGVVTVYLTNPIQNVGATAIVKVSDYKTELIREPGGVKPRIASCDSLILKTVSSTSTLVTSTAKLVNGSFSPLGCKLSFDLTIQSYFIGTGNTGSYTSHAGTATGKNRNGRAFSVLIPTTTPLVKHKTCNSFDEGRCEITPEGFNTRLADFGNGSCDENATFSINGNIIAFKLK